jgi:hypothetical protein
MVVVTRSVFQPTAVQSAVAVILDIGWTATDDPALESIDAKVTMAAVIISVSTTAAEASVSVTMGTSLWQISARVKTLMNANCMGLGAHRVASTCAVRLCAHVNLGTSLELTRNLATGLRLK